jgi:pre-mRNA-splicing factor CDC5/CEF1
MFQTPFRTPHGEINATPLRTPMNAGQTPLTNATVRDKLNINPEDGLYAMEDKAKQKEYLNELKKGLSRLPAPKNDYEIVLPDDENERKPNEDEEMEHNGMGEQFDIMDQAEIEARRLAEMRAREEEAMKYKSKAIQRDLPRPSDMNHSILRPADIIQNDYQLAEELIKREMLTMLHHDALFDPALSQCGIPAGDKKKPANGNNLKAINHEKHRAHLKENGYDRFSLDELAEANNQIEKEMPVVRKAMGHGELTSEAYAQVWEECYAQVLYVPSTNRFTRASVTSRKDKIESYEKKLETNRFHMSNLAKKAGKLDQKLRITLGGYQSRAQMLFKSLQDVYNQIESKQVELQTFEHIRNHELEAIPKRLSVLNEDLNRQVVRERELQTKFAEYMDQLRESKQQTVS